MIYPPIFINSATKALISDAAELLALVSKTVIPVAADSAKTIL
jgi:hypothetical protein